MQNHNLALAVDPQAEGAQNSVHPKPALTVVKRRLSLWSYRSMETRFSRRRIHLDNGAYTLFRVR